MRGQERGRRSYGQYCALAHALDVVGERWTLLVVRELLLGPLRYTDLLDGLPGIGTNLLARRLRDLAEAGIVERRVLPPPAAASGYALTRRGRALEPAIIELGRFGGRLLPGPRQAPAVRSRWAVTGLKLTFRVDRARGVRASYQLDLDNEAYRVRVDDGVLHAYQGEADQRDLTIRSTASALLELLAGDITARGGVADGTIAIRGAIGDLEQFVELFGWARSA
ncbi:winged helix-turn-helix transcriptional regulator [Pseudonocardia nigra]|uniref:winged helix-turn-helix transcriptional regulator n=1 Tax=Pseudonocardia nigra TaxID=1921578 RepID=UPI001C5F7874|nr:winged helix-turn-helix transcriptional regulator [Pseudonocardia nigra]